VESNALQGSWKAVRIMEGPDTVLADLSHVRITFDEDHFVFQRTAIDSIKGKYSLKDKSLIMISDATPADSLKVQVHLLEGDKMALRMNNRGVEQIVHLIRN
jgi:hypothetical protein